MLTIATKSAAQCCTVFCDNNAYFYCKKSRNLVPAKILKFENNLQNLSLISYLPPVIVRETLKILLQVFSQNLDLAPAKINKKSIRVRLQSNVGINCKIKFRKVFTNYRIASLILKSYVAKIYF